MQLIIPFELLHKLGDADALLLLGVPNRLLDLTDEAGVYASEPPISRSVKIGNRTLFLFVIPILANGQIEINWGFGESRRYCAVLLLRPTISRAW